MKENIPHRLFVRQIKLNLHSCFKGIDIYITTLFIQSYHVNVALGDIIDIFVIMRSFILAGRKKIDRHLEYYSVKIVKM